MIGDLQLPDGQEVTIGVDRFRVPEILFNPVRAPEGLVLNPDNKYSQNVCIKIQTNEPFGCIVDA